MEAEVQRPPVKRSTPEKIAGLAVWLFFLTGMNIGTGSTVGTGSAVIKDVPPFHVVAGNPAPRESLARTVSKEPLDEAL